MMRLHILLGMAHSLRNDPRVVLATTILSGLVILLSAGSHFEGVAQ